MTDTVSYAHKQFWVDRDSVIRANYGRAAISMIALLPRAPEGVWRDVSETIASLPSPLRFLAHLFVDTACPSASRPADAEVVWFHGFLGSDAYWIDRWTLLPAIGVWAKSPRMVDAAVRHLSTAIHDWHQGNFPLRCTRSTLPDPEDLRGFVPYGRVPNRRLVDAFLTASAPLLGIHAPVATSFDDPGSRPPA